MYNISFKLNNIKCSNVSSENNMFRHRFSFDDDDLHASIKAHGILMPPVVYSDNKIVHIVDGFKRIYYAGKCGMSTVNVLVMPSSDLTREDMFRWTLLNNAKSGFLSELDRAYVILQCREQFNLTDETIKNNILPCMGLPPSHKLLSEYTQLIALSPAVLKLVNDTTLNYRSALLLHKWPFNDQELLCEGVFKHCQFSVSEMRTFIEFLINVTVCKNVSLNNILKISKMGTIIKEKSMSRREKAEAVLNYLRYEANPVLSKMETIFNSVSTQVTQGKNIRISHSPYFEDDTIDVHIRSRNVKQILKAVKELEDKEQLLAELFDVDKETVVKK